MSCTGVDGECSSDPSSSLSCPSNSSDSFIILFLNRFRSSILNSEDAMHILAPLSGKIGTNLGINGFGVSDDGKES